MFRDIHFRFHRRFCAAGSRGRLGIRARVTRQRVDVLLLFMKRGDGRLRQLLQFRNFEVSIPMKASL
jgi:hypothetical protein